MNADAEAKEVDEGLVASTIIGRYLPVEGVKKEPRMAVLNRAEIRAARQSIELDNDPACRYDDVIKVCFCKSYL